MRLAWQRVSSPTMLTYMVLVGILGSLVGPWGTASSSTVTDPPPTSLTGAVDSAIGDTIESLGYDPERARRWIRAHVLTETYPGAMKGPRGAFLTRSANDIDQALLLGAFLDQAVVPYRFATCEVASETPTSEPAPIQPSAATLAGLVAAAFVDPEVRAATVGVPRSSSHANKQLTRRPPTLSTPWPVFRSWRPRASTGDMSGLAIHGSSTAGVRVGVTLIPRRPRARPPAREIRSLRAWGRTTTTP